MRVRSVILPYITTIAEYYLQMRGQALFKGYVIVK